MTVILKLVLSDNQCYQFLRYSNTTTQHAIIYALAIFKIYKKLLNIFLKVITKLSTEKNRDQRDSDFSKKKFNNY